MKGELPHAKIKHVVVLMLENRGFDHLMGWLYGNHERPLVLTANGGEDLRPFLGLSTLDAEKMRALANPYAGSPGETVQPIQGARSPKTPSYNPGEHFPHIMNQMWGVCERHEVWKDAAQRGPLIAKLSISGTRPPPMTGYVLDYAAEVQHVTGSRQAPNKRTQSEILETFVPAQMPVLSGLARAYAVSDEWFCSVPSQTNTNRAFSTAATSRGLVNNSFYDPVLWNPGVEAFRVGQGVIHTGWALLNPWSDKRYEKGVSHADALPPSTRSVFEVLQEWDISWKLYWQEPWPPRGVALGRRHQYVRTMFPLLSASVFDPQFVQFDGTRNDNALFQAARDGQLPAVTWIEPRWGGGPSWDSGLQSDGNDMHPVADTTVSEDFVAALYDALTSNSDAWPETLLIITFDENGGTYDHVPPPSAIDPERPDLPPPWGPTGLDRCPYPDRKFIRAGMDLATRTQYGFDFTQYGVRVPTLLVSPWIDEAMLFRSGQTPPFDHTSIIATVLEMAGVPRSGWNLGQRVLSAPTLERLLRDSPRDTAPCYIQAALTVPRPWPVTGSTPPLLTQTPYLLQFIGDNWPPDDSAPLYLAQRAVPRTEPTAPYSFERYLCPELTSEPGQAGRFVLMPPNGDEEAAAVGNMHHYRIRKMGSSPSDLFIGRDQSRVFYQRKADCAGNQWQVRLLSSRQPGLPLCVDDLLSFLIPPGDTPLRRLRLTQRADDADCLDTLAGGWSLWKLTPAPG